MGLSTSAALAALQQVIPSRIGSIEYEYELTRYFLSYSSLLPLYLRYGGPWHVHPPCHHEQPRQNCYFHQEPLVEGTRDGSLHSVLIAHDSLIS